MAGRVMLDPSFLLSEEGLEWLEEDPALVHAVVVPWTFSAWLMEGADLEVEALVAPEDLERLGERRDRVAGVAGRLERFRHDEVELSPRTVEDVRLTLLAGGDGVAQLRAEEWAFLQSHSLLLSKLRRPIEAFRDSGAVILEYGRKAGMHLLGRVIPKEHLPEVITRPVLARAGAKWIVLGGVTVGGGTLGGVAGAALGGPLGAMVGSQAAGFAAQHATTAALIAIDP